MGDPRSRLEHRAIRLASFVTLFASLLAIKVETASAGYITLAWTSPTDQPSGRVAAYDLRIGTQALTGTDTLTWWNAATKIDMSSKVPAAPGQTESILLSGLVMGVRYYAILRSADAKQTWSSFSNIASFTPSLVTAAPVGDPAPALVLAAPRPTPTSGGTDVNLELPKAMSVDAGVFDAQGRLVRRLEEGFLAVGMHILHWDGRLDRGGDAASGVYWIRVTAGSLVKSVKLVLAR